METDAQTALRAAERGAAAPFVDQPPTPWWFAPAGGLWAGAMTAGAGLISGAHAVGIAVVAVALVLEAVFLRWYRRWRGVEPQLGRPPAELRPVLWAYLAGCVAVLVLTIAIGVLAGTAVAAIAATVLVAGGVALHERRYAAAAAATRARLAVPA